MRVAGGGAGRAGIAVNKPATRRLAAILVADVVGYSRHMEEDDAGTVARLREIRNSLVDRRISDNGGHVVSTSGDGMLVEFGSADASLRCAVEVQRAMAERNRPLAASERIEYRIGINLGDIIVDGDDIAGDGVNVAARLESIAEPGGICVSGAVRDQIHGNLDIAFVDIGERKVKNIARPIRAFAVALDAAAAPGVPVANIGSSPAPSTQTSPPALAPPAMSVGVMPLVALSESAASAHRAEAITRDLTSMLARSATIVLVVPVSAAQARTARDDIRTAARALNVRYLVEGEVQHDEDLIRIGLRLVNGATGEQVWSESTTVNEAAAPAERWQRLHAIAWHLSKALISTELRRIAAEPPEQELPLDYVLRALALDRTAVESLGTKRDQEKLLEEALRRDPNLVPALVLLTRILIQQIDYDIDADRDQVVRRMNDLTTKAVRLNDSLPAIWVLRSLALMFMGQWNAALQASSKGMQLEPYSCGLMLQHAMVTTLCGRPAEALTLIEQAIALDPLTDASSFVGEAKLLLGNYEAAIAACERSRARGSDNFMLALSMAAAYAHLGDAGNAAAAKAEVLRAVPGYTIAMHRSRGYSANPEYLRLVEEHLYSGMRKAGFAEA
jgi:adenylate cyclase